MRPQYWRRAWKKAGSILHQFGQTLRHSQKSLDDSVARWICSLEDIPASPSATLVFDEVKKTPDTCSRIYFELSKQLDLFSSSSRTSKATSPWDSTLFTRAYEEWVTGLRSDYSRRLSAGPLTRGSGSSFLRGMYPTPLGEPYGSSQNGSNASRPSAGTQSLETWSKNWTTPTTGDDSTAVGLRRSRLETGRTTDYLSRQAMGWQTPQTDSFRSRGGDRKDEKGLDQQAREGHWSTPTEGDHRRDDNPETWERRCQEKAEGGQDLHAPLTLQARTWRTPSASESERGSMEIREGADAKLKLRDQTENWGAPRAKEVDQLGIFTEPPRNWRQEYPTPTGQDSGSSGCAHLKTDSGRHAGVTLTDVAIGRGVHRGAWDGRWMLVKCGCGEEFETDSLDVPCPHCKSIRDGTVTYFETEREMREAWTTPTSRDSKGMSSESGRADESRSTANLADQALGRWNTPEAHNAKGCRGIGCSVENDLGRQATSLSGLQDQETPPNGGDSCESAPTSPQPSPSETAKRLNPRFVEWLMGVPFSWSETTVSACSETEWFRWWRLALSCTCWLAPRKEE